MELSVFFVPKKVPLFIQKNYDPTYMTALKYRIREIKATRIFWETDKGQEFHLNHILAGGLKTEYYNPD